MIKTGYNKGPSWWCDQCDTYHNGHVWMVRWTAGRPPKYCIKCELNWYVADARDILANLYIDQFQTPGTTRLIRELLQKHNLIPYGVPPERFAAMVNQSVPRRHLIES